MGDSRTHHQPPVHPDHVESIALAAKAPAVYLYRRAGSVWGFLAAALLCGGSAAALLVWSDRTRTPPSPALVAVIASGACLTPLLLWGAGLNWWRRRYNRQIDQLLASSGDAQWQAGAYFSRSLRDAGWSTLDTSLPLLAPRRTWAQLQNVIQSQSACKPKALVDARLAEVCYGIDITTELLDPESLDSRISGDRVMFVWRSSGSILFCSLLFSSCIVWRSGWVGLAVTLPLCILFYAGMAAWPILRGGVPRLRAAPIAAMGVVIDHCGRRWTSAESILIVEPRDSNIIATLYGPAGCLRMRFHEQDDAAFTALWRHWTHPNPRLDLLERSA